MKHLKKYNEAKEVDHEKLEILENFAYISDKLGEPYIVSTKYGDGKKWTLSWMIGMDLSVLQEANNLIPKLKDIVEDIDDILSAGDRMEKYNINMCLTDELRLELVPKEFGKDTFKFIHSFDDNSTTLYVNINEVERYFNSKGVRVIDYDFESSYNEYSGTNYLEIQLSKTSDANREFYTMIMAELNPIRDDQEYQVRSEGNTIIIYPDGEKAYVEVVTN